MICEKCNKKCKDLIDVTGDKFLYCPICLAMYYDGGYE